MALCLVKHMGDLYLTLLLPYRHLETGQSEFFFRKGHMQYSTWRHEGLAVDGGVFKTVTLRNMYRILTGYEVGLTSEPLLSEILPNCPPPRAHRS